MKFSILAPGNIANSMAAAVTKLNEIECYAAASRTLEKAQQFADKWGFQKAYGSYEEMLEDPEVELVYVATPHSHHFQYAKMCLEYGKHVLVEKPITVNAAQAEELFALAKEKNLLVAEAMWSRYMPVRKMVDTLIAEGEIGQVSFLSANLGFNLSHVERMQKPELAGGALLDLGVYPINFALMTIHSEVKELRASVIKSPEGVDWINTITLIFEDGKVADLHSNMLSQTDCHGVISGDKGYMVIDYIPNCEEIRVFDLERRLKTIYKVPEKINGYEYEVLACKKAIEEGKLECEEMPHTEILRVMKMMDQVRESWGMKYPCE